MKIRKIHLHGRSTDGGSYDPNHLLIRLSAETPYIDGRQKNGRVNMAHHHIFMHEYWHYIQNVTTITGFKSFAFAQHVVALFTHTLKRGDQLSEGDLALSLEQRQRLSALIDLQLDFGGDIEPNEASRSGWNGEPVDFKVVAIQEDRRDIIIGARPAPNHLVTLDLDVTDEIGATHRCSILLGSAAIEESVAYLIEEEIRRQVGMADFNPPPEFPYRVVERVLEYITGRQSSSPLYPAALATLALLTVHPGRGLLHAVRHYQTALQAGNDEVSALNKTCAFFAKEIVPQAVDHILDFDLPELIKMHQGRGLIENAMLFIGKMFEEAFRFRLENPIFDIVGGFRKSRKWNTQTLQQSFPSCDVVQEYIADDGQHAETMYCLNPTPPDEAGLTPTDVTRTFQLQQHYVFAHIDYKDARFVESSQSPASCPFFYSCTLKFRKRNAEICEHAPWETYGISEKGCFYASAVASTIGLVSIRRLSK